MGYLTKGFFRLEYYFSDQTETVTITSKNYGDHKFGIRPDDSSSELYIVPDHFVPFAKISPGLTGGTDTVSFKSKYDGKYMKNENGKINLRRLEENSDYALAATFKIHPNKFFDVSSGR